jgi:hypothetical protein
MKKVRLELLNFILVFCFFVIGYLCFAAEEQISITTYFPPPVGVFRELRAHHMGVGVSYSNDSQYCWEAGCDYPADNTVSLMIEGRVGLGTLNASAPLDIVWIPIPDPNINSTYGSWAEAIGLKVVQVASRQNGSISFPDARAQIAFGADRRGFYVIDESPVEHNEIFVDFDLNLTNIKGLDLSRLGINISGPLTSDFQVNGTSNTCVYVNYGSTLTTECPAGYQLIVPGEFYDDAYSESSYAAPYSWATTGTMTCCRTCQRIDANRDGFCDEDP